MAARKAVRKKATRKSAPTPRKKPGPKPGEGNSGKTIGTTEKRYNMFLSAYRKIGNMRQCANLAGLDPRNVYDRMDADPAFRAKVQKAKGKLVEKIADKQVVAATTPDAHGRYDTKAGQFMLTNLDPENYKHRREETTFDGDAYESGIKKARDTLTDDEKKELQEIGKRRILQRGSGD